MQESTKSHVLIVFPVGGGVGRGIVGPLSSHNPGQAQGVDKMNSCQIKTSMNERCNFKYVHGTDIFQSDKFSYKLEGVSVQVWLTNQQNFSRPVRREGDVFAISEKGGNTWMRKIPYRSGDADS